MSNDIKNMLPSAGIDIGTAFMVAARNFEEDGKTLIKTDSVRDAFISLPLEQAPMLDISDVRYVTGAKELYVVGNDAINLSGVMGSAPRRPLSKGFVSSREEDAKEILQLIISKILGDPIIPSEQVVFSIPGKVFDATTKKIDTTSGVFHTQFFTNVLKIMGYKPIPTNEAAAIVYSECMQSRKLKGQECPPLTALSISFGAGTTNVALVYKSLVVHSFCIPFGGDYIDQMAAEASGSSTSHITLLKEHGVDVISGKIVNPMEHHDTQSERQAENISLMYRKLINDLTIAANTFFAMPEHRTEIKETIPVIISGGTSKAEGFKKLFQEIFINNLDVRFFFYEDTFMAADPLAAVSRGCLNMSRMIHNRKK